MKLKRIRERNQRILTDLNGFIGGDSGDSQKADFQYFSLFYGKLCFCLSPCHLCCHPLNSIYILYNFPFGFKKDILEI
jgi:hypothetical protein